MNYTVNSGQTIFDVAINTIVDLNKLYVFIKDNNIPNIDSVIVGLNVAYTKPPITPPTINSSKQPSAVTSKDFLSIPGQSVYDVVLQTYGDLNMTYKLIQDSNFSNSLNYPIPQTTFKFNPTLQGDAVFASYLSKKGIIINTVSDNQGSNQNVLLQENGFDILLEDGSKINLE